MSAPARSAGRRAQAYVDGELADEIEEPSVITLNSVATSLAATDFLLMATGLVPEGPGLDASVYYPQERELRARTAIKRPACRFCGDGEESVLARGDLKGLSLKPGSRANAVAAPARGLLGRLRGGLSRRTLIA